MEKAHPISLAELTRELPNFHITNPTAAPHRNQLGINLPLLAKDLDTQRLDQTDIDLSFHRYEPPISFFFSHDRITASTEPIPKPSRLEFLPDNHLAINLLYTDKQVTDSTKAARHFSGQLARCFDLLPLLRYSKRLQQNESASSELLYWAFFAGYFFTDFIHDLNLNAVELPIFLMGLALFHGLTYGHKGVLDKIPFGKTIGEKPLRAFIPVTLVEEFLAPALLWQLKTLTRLRGSNYFVAR